MPDINCPSDTFFYGCTIENNSTSYTTLTWTVTVPGSSALNITYSNSSRNTMYPFGPDTHIQFSIGTGIIESLILFTVAVNGTVIQCSGSGGTPQTLILPVSGTYVYS